MGGEYNSLKDLESALNANLRALEKTWGCDPREDTAAARFRGLMERAFDQTGKRVVVLVDEYDKPLIQTMGNSSLMDEMREKLSAFYGVLKATDQYLRFALLTGVTKFAKVNIFSELNQMNDISMDRDYAGICGISEPELIRYFADELHDLAKENNMTYEETLDEMRRRYNGYHFSKNSEGLFNPFSVLNTFFKRDFGYYWYETGTPAVLIERLRTDHVDLRQFSTGISLPESGLGAYPTEKNSLLPLLYQSGYLTIKRYDQHYKKYTLGFPNEEVKYAFLENLLACYMPDTQNNFGFVISAFVEDIDKGNIDGFMNRFRAFVASIPYSVKEEKESYYQGLFYVFFTLMGQFVSVEIQSARGRCDAVITTRDKILVFEFKLWGNGTVEDALRQIDDRGYLIPYTASGKRLFKIGVVFDADTRTLKEWRALM
jgi:hypothetical protein